MRWLVPPFFMFIFTACSNHDNNKTALRLRVDSLQKELNSGYRPGLGEFMSSIQLHHEKLWFAGQAQNWMLADFEIDEISESLNDIKTYINDRPEVNSLPMILPAVDSVNNAIVRKDPAQFREAYILLTNTCNNCHQATHHGFNVIKIPTTPPVSDQEFGSH